MLGDACCDQVFVHGCGRLSQPIPWRGRVCLTSTVYLPLPIYCVPATPAIYCVPATPVIYCVPATPAIYCVPATPAIYCVPATPTPQNASLHSK